MEHTRLMAHWGLEDPRHVARALLRASERYLASLREGQGPERQHRAAQRLATACWEADGALAWMERGPLATWLGWVKEVARLYVEAGWTDVELARGLEVALEAALERLAEALDESRKEDVG